MWPVVTDQVVCWSVCHTNEPCKNGWTIRDAVWILMGSGNRVLDGVQIPHGKGQLWGKERPFWLSAVSCAKTAQPINLPFGIGGHIGATWQIQLNHLSAVAMRPYVILVWALVTMATLRSRCGHCIFCPVISLWLPYVIGQAIYIFILSFVISFFFSFLA